MPAFDATLGSPSATSYITVAEADEYLPVLVSKARSDIWSQLESDAKEVHLMRAVRMLETYIDWDGIKVLDEQPLAWPREWVYGVDRCTSYNSDELPLPVGEAQALMALNLSEGFDQADSGASPVEQLKISSLSIKFAYERTARGTLLLPGEVIEKLRGFGHYSGSTGMARSVSVTRA